ncbi:hypothetical protein TcasGA2_TC015438 [Tribolium castaneum]|uniref:Uncharacterized protein n=1 Tax=Tribolium castaneum TaxID=7070 RepID=D2A4Y6_TRICA|nr:hypothetical protein TcasGA2_TC015438 [Tribolium castaneum]
MKLFTWHLVISHPFIINHRFFSDRGRGNKPPCRSPYDDKSANKKTHRFGSEVTYAALNQSRLPTPPPHRKPSNCFTKRRDKLLIKQHQQQRDVTTHHRIFPRK